MTFGADRLSGSLARLPDCYKANRNQRKYLPHKRLEKFKQEKRRDDSSSSPSNCNFTSAEDQSDVFETD